jgi:hypothetical protein
VRTQAAPRRTGRRITPVVVLFVVAAATLGVLAPMAGAKAPCRARNVTQGTPRSTDLQAVLDAAASGDMIAIKFVCQGNFTIDTSLTMVGRSSSRVPKPVLLANGVGRVLVVNASATLKNLKITGGDAGSDFGGGIWNHADLVLRDVLVRGNRGGQGAAIWNEGSLVLKGSSAVTENTTGPGQSVVLNGTSVGSTPILRMFDSSSVRDNIGGSIKSFRAIVRLNDSASVAGNTDSGGIFARLTLVVLNDASSVSGNTGFAGAGINADRGTIVLNDASTVGGNSSGSYGGGIYAFRHSSVTMNDSSSIIGNTANADDKNDGSGGGIYAFCDTSLGGVVDGGNVNDNYVGTKAPAENNVVLLTC